jgi:hypothetical protein
MTRVYLELGPTKVFACALDWPGWCRIGRSEEAALDTWADYAPRYRVIAEHAGLDLDTSDPVVVERVRGSSTTDFGAPAAIPDADAAPLTRPAATRLAGLVQASWAVFDTAAATSPESLRKGPRGGGRDRDKMIAHVVDAERAYARKIGVRHKPFAFADHGARDAMRDDVISVLSARSDGTPLTPGGWPPRYAARRIAWHVIDHLWEMQDRRT